MEATVYMSKVTGEFAMVDAANRLAWIDRNTAKEVCESGIGSVDDDSVPMAENDPLWDSLVSVSMVE